LVIRSHKKSAIIAPPEELLGEGVVHAALNLWNAGGLSELESC